MLTMMHYHWFQVFTHLLTSSHGSRNKRIGVEGRPVRNSWPISKPMVTAKGSDILELLPVENGGFLILQLGIQQKVRLRGGTQ